MSGLGCCAKLGNNSRSRVEKCPKVKMVNRARGLIYHRTRGSVDQLMAQSELAARW